MGSLEGRLNKALQRWQHLSWVLKAFQVGLVMYHQSLNQSIEMEWYQNFIKLQMVLCGWQERGGVKKGSSGHIIKRHT